MFKRSLYGQREKCEKTVYFAGGIGAGGLGGLGGVGGGLGGECNGMASEAQRLIGMSLSKIAQARTVRGSNSLHKNLLVATVLQKARYTFMEEACQLVHYKEPPPQSQPQPRTYLDLDRPQNVLRYHQPPVMMSSGGFKRKRALAGDDDGWETEEAVQSILPKRTKSDEEDDNVFDEENAPQTAMEIDRITSLVSIFGFSSSNRSVSTPDLCSAQAKEAEALQQRPFLAMTV